jgi:hypothetical protein
MKNIKKIIYDMKKLKNIKKMRKKKRKMDKNILSDAEENNYFIYSKFIKYKILNQYIKDAYYEVAL